MKKALGALALILITTTAQAEDLNQIFTKVNEYVAKQNYSKAIEELGWAKKEIEKLHLQRVQSFFPDVLLAFQGDPAQSNAAMGFTNVERNYRQGASRVKVSLLGSSGGAAGGGLGGLAALGQMAAMMGGQQGSGQDTFRIAGRTATLSATRGSKNTELTVFLESGSMLKIESSSGVDGDQLKELAENLKISDLDNYLKGVS